MALTIVLLTIFATRLVAAHHPAQQRTRQDGSGIGHLLDQSFARGGKFGNPIFHVYVM
jgi:hypothetical protein